MVTLNDLNNTVNRIESLAIELRKKLYPNGKPDWMSQEQWNDINWEDKTDDTDYTLPRIPRG